MRANIRQVAHRANVSRMTVSRVLQNRRDEVTEDKYERVIAALKELNYVPVRTAVQNHHSRTNVVGVVPYTANFSGYQIDLQTFGGLCKRSGHYGYDVLVLQRGESEWMANRQELRFLDRRTDGFIFISLGVTEWENALELLQENQIPVVVCYRRDVPEGVAWVDPDNEAIVNLAVDRLVGSGHSKIAYLAKSPYLPGETFVLADLSGSRPNFDDVHRQQFFLKRVKQLGTRQPEAAIFHGKGRSNTLSPEEVDRIIAGGFTGVVCFSAGLGLQLLEQLEARGLKVPQDMSIVSHDWHTDSLQRGLTHITFDYATVGQLAMDAWMELAGGRPAAECCKLVPVQLVECRSVAKPPSAARRANAICKLSA